MASPGADASIRFGPFELSGTGNALRKHGILLKIQPQPLRILLLLAERPGEIITRDQIRQCLWGDHTFVDFDRGINFCINQIRTALADDPENPRYVETIPRSGYRFIAVVTPEPPDDRSETSPVLVPAAIAPAATPARSRWLRLGVLVVATAALAAAVLVALTIPRSDPGVRLTERQVTAYPFENWVDGAAISPDGHRIAYHNQKGLYVQSLDSGETHPVAVPEALLRRILHVEWFPDGGRLLAENRGDELWVLNLLGEPAPSLLYENATSAAISPDGQSIAFQVFGTINVGDVNGAAPRPLFTRAQDQYLYNAAWSPDSRWIAYRTFRAANVSAIEVRPAAGGLPKVLVSESMLPKGELLVSLGYSEKLMRWSPDWRLFFCSGSRSSSGLDRQVYSLWEVSVDRRTLTVTGPPRRLSKSLDYPSSELTMTADGKRLLMLKTRAWEDVYVGQLGGSGASLSVPHRLTLDNRGSAPLDWSSDSRSVVFVSRRNGKPELFWQGIQEAEATLLAAGVDARISPDHLWLLYSVFSGQGQADVERSALGLREGEGRLMRRPLGGGSPEMVLKQLVGRWSFGCPARGSSCVLCRREGEQLVFYSLDPARGLGKPLARIALRRVFPFPPFWDLSPDGSRIAVVGVGPGEDIEVLTLSDGTRHQIPVERVQGLRFQSVTWARDGNGIFVTSWNPDSSTLLHITLRGRVQRLLEMGHQQWLYNPLPSPDGKYLAYQALTRDSNAWLMENF